MKNKTILLLTCSEKTARDWEAETKDTNFSLCGIYSDGEEGLRQIERLAPDVIICDLFLKSLDGLGVSERAKELSLGGAFILILPTPNDHLVESAMEKGVKYCIIKPYSVSSSLVRLTDILQEEKSQSQKTVLKKSEPTLKLHDKAVEERISNIFSSIGIPPHIKGYAYLREGICMAIENPTVINNVTKVLYPGIARTFATSASKVERAIRHAIEVAWNRGRTDAINSIFGARVYIGTEKPTNSEFIALVADKLILENMM